MSNLHNIPVKTLRYYDEIDLFKPVEVDTTNGYRYYSIEQFKLLDIINYLKILGVPLKEIKQQITNRDINDFLHTLKKHKEITEQKLKELQAINKRLDGRIAEIERIRDINDIAIPIVKTIKERTVFQMHEKISSAYDLEISLRKIKTELHPNVPLFIGKVGLTISEYEIARDNFFEYNSIFLLIEEVEEKDVKDELITTFPAGDYVCIYFRGGHSEAPPYYRMLLDYVQQENYEISGEFIIRTIIDRFISNDRNDFITEIQLPIKVNR